MTNPILTGFHPDPSIVRVGDDFFLATSSFEYTPGVPLYHSRDLRTWTLIGHALTRPSQLVVADGVEPGGGVWAPTLRYHAGVFYLATSSFARFCPQQGVRLFPRGFCVTTTNIWDDAAWSDPVYFDVAGFDQDLFWDNGRVYLCTTHPKADRPADAPPSRLDFAIHLCEVDLVTGRSLSPAVMLRDSTVGSCIAEGSHLYRRGRYYYLLVAEGGTGAHHSECVYRSTEGVRGPWEPAPGNPILKSQAENDDVQNTGHVDLVEDAQGQWWAVLLGVRPLRGVDGAARTSVFGRETFLVPVTWVDDWPVINHDEKVCLGLGAAPPASQDWHDDFTTSTLSLGWYRKNYTILANPPRLRLHGGPYSLSSPGSPNLLLRKQQHRSGRWIARLSFRPADAHEEAGTVVYWNYTTYSSIGVGISKTTRERVVRFRSPDGETAEHPLVGGGAVLVIQCTEDGYRLGFLELDDSGEQPHWLGSVDSAVMTCEPPVGMAFSGMLLGVYAFAEHHGLSSPADFSSVSFHVGVYATS
ncbi:hypothetical protein SEUCBS140593_002317 [Sporothrix eucalyptigena]|uniref:Beta-xylosidase C-terminal Concanavalin A-like domain-containing protein n=1 Tax=Sporothrix eucalyptigena TaxID=1812306 RepID=A0ABP0B5E7_9PEZI